MTVAGTYTCVIKSPMGDQNCTLTVNPEGETFTGSVSGQLGSMDIEEGDIDGNTLMWQMKIAVPMPMTLDCTATIDGDNLEGKVTAGAFGSFPMQGARV